MGVFAFLLAIVFMPTTILLLFGMLPTVAAALADRKTKGMRAMCIGTMNLAGCTPFVLELWLKGHTAENSLDLITDPRTIIVIYCAAGIGYLIEWALSGILTTVMTQNSVMKINEIQKKQAALVERWGLEVSGTIPLDSQGFPLDSEMGDKGSGKKSG